MADISQVKLPSGTTYNLKDSDARTRIEALEQAAVHGIKYIGVSTTAITDGGNEKPTIGGSPVTPDNGNLVFYDNKEYVFTGTWSSSTSTGAWEEFGDMGDLGTLAYKSSASGSFTPAGSVSSTWTGTSTTFTGSYTPEGSISATFTGKKYNLSGSIAANGVTVSGNYDKTTGMTVATSETIPSGSTATYTPKGNVSKPDITVTPTTTTVTEVASVGTLPTKASVSSKFTVANEVLTIADFDYITGVGTLPTTNNETVMTGASAALASTPSFTGTGVMITATPSTTSTAMTAKNASAVSVPVTATENASGSFQPSGTISGSFTGTAKNVSVSGTPSGSVSSTFTGTAGTVTVS